MILTYFVRSIHACTLILQTKLILRCAVAGASTASYMSLCPIKPQGLLSHTLFFWFGLLNRPLFTRFIVRVRREIMRIHTRAWQPTPPPTEWLDSVADRAIGFAGVSSTQLLTLVPGFCIDFL